MRNILRVPKWKQSIKTITHVKAVAATVCTCLVTTLLAGTGLTAHAAASKPVEYKGEIIIKEPVSSSKGDLTKKAISNKAMLPGAAHPETAPSIFSAGGKRYMVVSTGHSMIIPFRSGKTGLDIFNSFFALDSDEAWLATDNWAGSGAAQTGGGWAKPEVLNADASWKDGQPYWKRNYYGIFNSQVVTIGGKEYLLNLMHGENKNEKFADGRKYINTVQPKRNYGENEYSGPRTVNGQMVYDDYASSYFAFVGITCVPVSSVKKGKKLDAPEFDYGPVVWPSNGYINSSGQRVNSGLRHPSMYIDKEFIYIYYLDNDQIRAARAPLSSKGAAGSFKMYYNGSFSEPALPKGFNKNSRAFFSVAGGKSTPLFNDSRSLRFSVAKLEGTPFYIGVEEYFTIWPRVGIRLRLSRDLVNWNKGVELPGSFVSNYNEGTLHYPVLYNAGFTSQNTVNPKDFYIVGEWGNNIGRPTIQAVHVSIEVK